MGYTAGYNFDISNLDGNFYKKLSTGTPIPFPYKTITIPDLNAYPPDPFCHHVAQQLSHNQWYLT